MENFIKNTIDTDKFQVEDVANDNACFYRSVANVINYNSESNDINTLTLLEIGSYKTNKDIQNVYKNEYWGYSGTNQDILARKLQEKSLEWVMNNREVEIKEFGTSLENLIVLTHEIDFDNYVERYRYFAGDNVVDKINSGELDIYNKPIYLEEDIGDRWGGLTEQISLSSALQVPIIILTSQKYDTKRQKIINGKVIKDKPEKNVRFKLLQIIGTEFIGKSNPIYILWKKYNKTGHYMALYCRDQQSTIYNIFDTRTLEDCPVAPPTY